jgi:hypothetical protein
MAGRFLASVRLMNYLSPLRSTVSFLKTESRRLATDAEMID